jgi:hypothetical protein
MRRFDQITTGKNKAPVRIRVVFSLEELNMHITVGDHADQRNVRRSIAKAVRNSSRTWNCLLVAIVLLNVLTWIWFPMTMAIWTAISFIATGGLRLVIGTTRSCTRWSASRRSLATVRLQRAPIDASFG